MEGETQTRFRALDDAELWRKMATAEELVASDNTRTGRQVPKSRRKACTSA